MSNSTDSDSEPYHESLGSFVKDLIRQTFFFWCFMAIMTFSGIQKRLDDWAIRKGMEWRERRLQRRRERELQLAGPEAGTQTAPVTADGQAQMAEVSDVGHSVILNTIVAQAPDTTEAKAEDGAVEATEEDRIPVEQAVDYGTQGAKASDGQ
ncbi:hypothetical protein Dda_0150 [Drechslerella dactyloides]|uniref:Uncharacterized protein n=1 Tax=Drechslerella dactyloides TaxID=74499 RepID=A0AAD6NLN7_DREDA|nr:hypothetical protein Dda_0150 [Drechslerella dactyloides]